MKLEQIPTPALILDMDIFEANRKKLVDLLKPTKLSFRPHYKSNKCVAIAHLQISDGAKGITCAKLGEAKDLIESGIQDVLIANQIVDPLKMDTVASLAKCCHLGVCVDNAENIAALEAAAAAKDATLYVLVEYNIGLNRCGVNTPEAFCALAAKVKECKHLVFEGIQAYAGHLSHEEDYEQRVIKSKELEDERLKELLAYCAKENIHIKEISGVSTGTVELHTNGSLYTEVQTGSYIFMDAAYKRLHTTFCNSLFILTTVVSANGASFATDAGRKSIADDQASPILIAMPGAKVRVSEEHCTVWPDSPDTKVNLGDKFLVIPGHCCTTMNLHEKLYMVRKGQVVDCIPVTSRGKSI